MPAPKKVRSKGSGRARKAPPRMIPQARVAHAVEVLSEPSGTARFGAGKALAYTAQKDPARVYPCFEAIAALLPSDSKIVRWNAMQILAPLAAVDAQRKLDAVLDEYLAFIRGSNLITAANAIGGAATIAGHRPDLLERIVPAMLEVEHQNYETPECRNVAIQQTLRGLESVWPLVRSRPEVARFVRAQCDNPRIAAGRLARQLTADLSH